MIRSVLPFVWGCLTLVSKSLTNAGVASTLHEQTLAVPVDAHTICGSFHSVVVSDVWQLHLYHGRKLHSYPRKCNNAVSSYR